MTRFKNSNVVLVVLALCFVAPACKTKSALDKAIDQRARWTVLALDWTQTADHVVLLSTRLSGPPNSTLDHLTVRILLQDAAGEMIQEAWHVYDLGQLPRGGPKDFTIRIPAAVPVEGLAVDPVPRPNEDERVNIRELSGL